jgi:hypothetical protein
LMTIRCTATAITTITKIRSGSLRSLINVNIVPPNIFCRTSDCLLLIRIYRLDKVFLTSRSRQQ